MLPGPHYTPGEKEDEEEESGLEYETDTLSKDSYTTPLSTGGHSEPSLAPSCLPTLEDSDPETCMVLHTEELEVRIKAFLEEAEEDMEMNDLPLLKNVSLLLVLASVVPSFVPFTVSTGQHCILPKSLVRKVWHPYQDSVGQCHCEPGGWCSDLPCAGWVLLGSVPLHQESWTPTLPR